MAVAVVAGVGRRERVSWCVCVLLGDDSADDAKTRWRKNNTYAPGNGFLSTHTRARAHGSSPFTDANKYTSRTRSHDELAAKSNIDAHTQTHAHSDRTVLFAYHPMQTHIHTHGAECQVRRTGPSPARCLNYAAIDVLGHAVPVYFDLYRKYGIRYIVVY